MSAPTTVGPDVEPEAGFRVDIDAELATITLNRPERMNCQGPVMWDSLVTARRALPATVRVVVLRGEGRAFSAGLDRKLITGEVEDGILDLPKLSQGEATAKIEAWQQAFDWSSRPDLVSIAAVQGHAIGGGFQLALGADIRVVADDVQFCMAEAMLGIVPDLGGTKRLVDLVGYSRAAEICLTGRRVGAEEALRIGLASHSVPIDALEAAVAQIVSLVLAIDRNAAAETKGLLAGAAFRTQSEQQQAEREAQYRRLRTIAGFED